MHLLREKTVALTFQAGKPVLDTCTGPDTWCLGFECLRLSGRLALSLLNGSGMPAPQWWGPQWRCLCWEVSKARKNIISVIDDVLCIKHGSVYLLTRGNIFMLAKALMGQGKKKETELMLCCGCQKSQTTPWQEAECKNQLCFQTCRSSSFDLQSCQRPAVLRLSVGWGSSHSGNLSKRFKIKPLASNSAAWLNTGAQRAG